MSVYTNIPKPTGTPYTPVTLVGFLTYDNATVTYSSATVTYNGADPNTYVPVPKPTGAVYTNIPKPTT